MKFLAANKGVLRKYVDRLWLETLKWLEQKA